MIGVQKRKATCQQQPTNNNNEQTQQTANKRPRKRAKISSVNPSKTNNKQQNQRYQHQQATTCQFQQTFDSNTASTIHSNHNNSNGSEESVWIFGLMNNIEQLLSTFSAINNNGSANSSHSLSSSSSSPSSSASISALSSPASTTSSTPSYSSTNTNNNTINSHSQSPSSSNFSTTNNVLSTSSSAISSMQQQQQQAGTVCQATNQLPRSPISRQIKFHEYKGPPSSKRQQQQFATNSSNSKQQVKTIHSSNVSTAVNSNQTKLVGDIEREQQQLLLNRANMMMMTNKQQLKSSIVSDPSSVNFKAEANKSAPISTATATNTTTIINVASKPCNQQQALLVSNKQPCLLSFTPQKQQQQQQQQQIQSQSLAMDHFQDLNQSFSIRTQTHTTQQLARQVNSSLASRVTSGPHFVQQQTNNNFYGGQVEHHGTNFKTPSDGPILLLAPPFIESKQELPIQPQLHYQQQQQPQQQQQQPIFQQTRNQATPCSSHGASSVESPIFMRSLHSIPNTSQQSICGLEFNLSVPARQQQQQLAQPTMQQVNETDHQEEQVSFEPSFTSSFEQKFDNHACLDSQLTTAFGSASEDGSEEQSTDEIEPSISFSQGVDELLFSEFIDLQDVPMNVDESDWLKKFLPPCSMG